MRVLRQIHQELEDYNNLKWLSGWPHSSTMRHFFKNATFFNSFLCSWCVWMPYTFPYFEKYRDVLFSI